MRHFAILALGLLAGCTVGPNYRQPDLPTPASFAEGTPALRQAVDDASLATWWKTYRDPELDRLVAIALAGSLDIKTAASRIRQARTQEITARAALFPEVDATGDRTHIHFSKNAGISSLASAFGGGGATGGGGASTGGIALPGAGITTYTLGFDASWEIDLFGGTRRSIEAARAQTAAAEWNARDAAVTLIAEVADDYLQLRLYQQREMVTRAEIDRQTRSLQLLGNTAKAGLVPEGDFTRQRAQLASSQAALPPIIAQQGILIHAIGTLLDRPPGDLIKELSIGRPPQPQPPIIPAGLPSDLLRRRPDVRAAERRLAAATAEIGVATADLYPRIDLTAMPQLISSALGSLFSTKSFQSTVAGAFNFPVLDFGRRRAQVESNKEAAEQAYIAYQQTVLTAFRDVEDALLRITTEQARNSSLRAGLADETRALHAVRARYDSGLIDLSAVLETEQTLLNDQDQLAQSDGMIRTDIVALYKALGGGWSATQPYRPPERSYDPKRR